jgi:membrane protein DedA with SNARE-associated domain
MEESLLKFFSHQGSNTLLTLTLVITLASLLKYVVPPLPGDLTILFASFYLALRQTTLLPVLFGITAGGMVGALIAYAIGAKKGRNFLTRKILQMFNGRFEAPFRKGAWFILVFNRFLPGIRPYVFPLAGIYGIDFRLVALSAFLGNFIYGIFVFSIASLAGKHFEDMKILYGLMGFWLEFTVLSLVAAGVLLFCKDKLFRYRRKADRT